LLNIGFDCLRDAIVCLLVRAQSTFSSLAAAAVVKATSQRYDVTTV